MSVRPTALDTLRRHWPEYLIEGWALALFMISAGAFTTLFEFPGTPLHAAIANADTRRALIGIAMGATAVGLIYSPWGRRSGAHMNPAVTFAFLSLGRIAPWDAAFYALAQFVGAALGVLATWFVLDDAFARPPVNFIATLPGPAGAGVAFVAEAAMSFVLMFIILIMAGRAAWARYTGLMAGTLVAIYIALEAPLSGMSINPARTLASALPRGLWHSIWIYIAAPCLGMWLAARAHAARTASAAGCAKLCHAEHEPCIHCGQLQ